MICTLSSALLSHQNANCAAVDEIDTIHFKSEYVYSLSTHFGRLLPTWSFMSQKYRTEGPEFANVEDLSFKVLKQTLGEKPIEQIFHYPRYGIGLYTGQFFRKEYRSRPIGIYGVFQGPFVELKKLSLHYSILLGLTGNWNHYDPAKNNFNTTLANDFTSHVDFGLHLNYELSPRYEAGIGCSFAHFSNGAMKIPNFGINMFTPQFTVTYLPENKKEKRIKRVIPKYLRNTFLDIAFIGGEKNLPYPECDLDTAHNFFGFHYPQFALTAVLNRNISYVVTLGFGLHLGYDSSKNTRYRLVNNRIEPDLRFLADNFNVGIIPSLELNFDKVAFVLQPCYSIYKHETSFKKPDFFGKFGLKFKLVDELYAGIQLHTFKLHADFIEFSLGYRFPITRQSS